MRRDAGRRITPSRLGAPHVALWHFGWIVAGLAARRHRAAVLLAVRARLTAEVRGARRSPAPAAGGAAGGVGEALRGAGQEPGRKRGEEIAELKKKLEKARKRAAAAHHERSDDSSRLKELEAALARAAESDYIFFVAKTLDPRDGHNFAVTLDEHNRNVAAYRALGAGKPVSPCWGLAKLGRVYDFLIAANGIC